MNNHTRREFLADVGRGMLVAGLGSTLAADLGLAPARADEEPRALSFGKLEPLVCLMQETPLERLLPAVVERLRNGTELRTLVAAAALANARTFGGHDYVGFHAFMALPPAWEMSRELPRPLQPLPVLKVLYRNTNRIHEFGGRPKEILRPVEPAALPTDRPGGELLQAATRRVDWDGAERTFAALAKGPAGEAFNHLQFCVQDEVDVHRVVLAWRAWAALDLTGKEQAHALLRQSVRYCLRVEQACRERNRPDPEIRSLLPRLLDEHRLLSRPLGKRQPDDAWVDRLAREVFAGRRDQAAEAAAAALAEGIDPDSVGEALSLAANMLVLHDPGRLEGQPGKPAGSVHGDSVGVHASDAANAWRNIAHVGNQRNSIASLIVGAYHTAGQSGRANKQPYPLPEHVEAVRIEDPKALLREAEAAIREKDQFRACAAVWRYGELGHAPRAVFDLLIRYATSEEGALHAEKYYRTVTEEFARTRPAFRWRHLAGLARVTASEYGTTAPGYEEACGLLKLES